MLAREKSVRNLSSAGRRKTKELKSNNVLPSQKDVSPRLHKQQVKDSVSVAESVDDSQQQRKAFAGTSKQAKDATSSVSHGSNDKKRNSLGRGVGNASSNRQQQKNQTANRTRTKAGTMISQQRNAAKTTRKLQENAPSQPDTTANASVISQAQLALLMEVMKGSDVSSLLQNVIAKESAPMATESQSSRVTEPTFVPGLDLGASLHGGDISSSNPATGKPEQHATDHQSVDTVSFTSRNELQALSYNSTPTQSHQQTSPAAQMSARAEPVAMRSSFAIGAPGQVSVDYRQDRREKSKQYLADLEKQIQLKKSVPLSSKEKFILAMEDPASKPVSSRVVKAVEPSSATSKYEAKGGIANHEAGSRLHQEHAPRQGNSTTPAEQHEQAHAFGARQPKNQFELDEIELKRIKLLEHQRAVQEQVEEKRRLKMQERDRKLREEQDIDEKLRKEREMLTLQYEEEVKRQQAKEEAERQRQVALQQSVLEAYESAKQDKHNSILLKLKAGGHDISHLQHDSDKDYAAGEHTEDSFEQRLKKLNLLPESNEMSQQFSSRTDKEFRPILNLNDDTSHDESSKKQTNPKNVKKDGHKQKTNAATNGTSVGQTNTKKNLEMRRRQEEKASQEIKKTNRTTIDSKKSSRSEPAAIERRTKKTVNKQANSVTGSSSARRNFTQKNEEAEKKIATKQIFEAKKKQLRKNKAFDQESSQGEAEMFSIESDKDDEKPLIDTTADVGYKRSSTVTLQGNESVEMTHNTTGMVNERRDSPNEHREEQSSWDSWKLPTNRQQQILEQLRTLRQVSYWNYDAIKHRPSVVEGCAAAGVRKDATILLAAQ
eukprot:gene7603-8443_t